MSEAPAFLLDTNAWFWMVTGAERIPPAVAEAIEAAAAEGRVYVTQISAWEIALKESIGKLRLNVPIARWLQENTEGLRLLDLPLEVIVDATNLPGNFHKDPADRFIVLCARGKWLPKLARVKVARILEETCRVLTLWPCGSAWFRPTTTARAPSENSPFAS